MGRNRASGRAGPCVLALALLAAACGGGSEPVQPETRRWSFRAIGGYSMGSLSAAFLGLRYHEQFDLIAPMGGPIDLTLLMHVARTELFGGFCSPPELGRMCRAPGAVQDYEHLTTGPEGPTRTSRTGMFENYESVSIAWGNFLLFNPEHPYLPPGGSLDRLTRPAAEVCADPIRLTGVYDRRYNPDGSHKVISYCEAKGIETGVFDPSAEPLIFPMELSLAVDLNDNGLRDSGEPVLFWGSEPWDDLGADGLASAEEAGYDPLADPDPAGDDWDGLLNPAGTEGNHVWDEGEPYDDAGLDGVAGQDSGGWDYGEGNGRFDFNPNIAHQRDQYDPTRLLALLPEDALDRLDFYLDVGIRDHFQFKPPTESFAGTLMARGRPVDIRDDFPALLEAGYDGVFSLEHIDWRNVGRDLLVRYGTPDATEAQITAGDGGHVGTYSQLMYRFFTVMGWLSRVWPGGADEPLTGASPTRVLAESYNSAILGREQLYWVLLPPGYDEQPEVRYPVVYLLHGIGMDPTDMTMAMPFLEGWMIDGTLQRMIMVFPDGRCGDECFDGNFFANQVGRHLPPLRYEDSFIQELVPLVDERYRTRPAEELPVD